MAIQMSNEADSVKITLHWLDRSRSQRILWLLEELHLPYEIVVHHRDKQMLAPPELKTVHPLGKAPILVVEASGDSTTSPPPIVLGESGFIVEYLCDHFGRALVPERYPESATTTGGNGVATESVAWMRYKYLLHYVEGSLMPYLVMLLVSDRIKSAPVPFFIKPISGRIAGGLRDSFVDPNIKTHFRFLEEQLATSPDGGQYICGAGLTGADILLSFPLIAAAHKGLLKREEWPKLAAYAEMLQEEDGYKRAVQKIVELEGSYSVAD